MKTLIEQFNYYYENYIGLSNGKNITIVSNNYRDIPINQNFYYPIIAGKINGKKIVSVSTGLYNDFNLFYEANKNQDIEETIKMFTEIKLPNCTLEYMSRYTKNEQSLVEISEVISDENELKSAFLNTSKKAVDAKYKEEQWNKIKSTSHYLRAIQKENKLASLGYISNIFFNAGNIVIQTIDDYRKCGYGKKIVEKISRDCLQDAILPIYWVNDKNIPSINLAESLGFRKMATELVVKYEDFS